MTSPGLNSRQSWEAINRATSLELSGRSGWWGTREQMIIALVTVKSPSSSHRRGMRESTTMTTDRPPLPADSRQDQSPSMSLGKYVPCGLRPALSRVPSRTVPLTTATCGLHQG